MRTSTPLRVTRDYLRTFRINSNKSRVPWKKGMEKR